jgi:hypothetical protein
MPIDHIMGYSVTDLPSVLQEFIAQARERYAAIEQAIQPIKAAITDLERDWTPRDVTFWQQVIESLDPVRQATQKCMALFDQTLNSQEHPAPLVLVATSFVYALGLQQIENSIEEAAILLFAAIRQSAWNSTSITDGRRK